MSPEHVLVPFGVELRDDVWRVARNIHPPMQTPPRHLQRGGRFDDLVDDETDEIADFGVLYVGETPTSTFLETLHLYRRRLDTARNVADNIIVEAETRQSLLNAEEMSGRVPNQWMDVRVLAHGRLVTGAPVFDLAKPAAVQAVRESLEPSLIALGLEDLDFSHVLGDNRDLTRAISRWIWSMESKAGQPLFAGIRYRSRFDPESICLALFEDRYNVDGDIDIQPITPETPGLNEAASVLRLEIP